MLETPDRIAGVIDAIEKGEQVDLRKLNDLLALDAVQLGRQFVLEAAQSDAEADDLAAQLVKQELGQT